MSVDSNGNQWTTDSCHHAAISGDGRYVAFHKIHPTTIYHHRTDVFVHDRPSGSTTEVDVTPNGTQTLGLYSSDPSASYDGSLIAFASTGADLIAGDTNASYDIFVRDMLAGSTERVSVDSSGVQGDGDSTTPSISSDGRFVAFTSVATNLVPGDVNAHADVFVHDRHTGVTVLASVDTSGVQANADCLDPSISSDGRFVAFHSTATNLVAGDTNNADDVFVRDLLLGTTERASAGTGGQANGASDKPAISADGRFVSFRSFASDLVSGDTNGTFDVFERDRGSAVAILTFCEGDGTGAACPCGNSGAPAHGCENSAVTGGALLTASGASSLSADTVQFQTSGELPSALSILIQGSDAAASVHFGDGLRCAGGSLKRLYVRAASNGSITAPQAGDPPVSARSAALGDPIPFGATRIYQVYYRDPNASFCPDPQGGTFNVSNAAAIVWER
jgi:Tol biopolymer transport system component